MTMKPSIRSHLNQYACEPDMGTGWPSQSSDSGNSPLAETFVSGLEDCGCVKGSQ